MTEEKKDTTNKGLKPLAGDKPLSGDTARSSRADAPQPRGAIKKIAFARLACDQGLNRARMAALKVCTGWADDTKITEAELKAAVDKHLKNKEG